MAKDKRTKDAKAVQRCDSAAQLLVSGETRPLSELYEDVEGNAYIVEDEDGTDQLLEATANKLSRKPPGKLHLKRYRADDKDAPDSDMMPLIEAKRVKPSHVVISASVGFPLGEYNLELILFAPKGKDPKDRAYFPATIIGSAQDGLVDYKMLHTTAIMKGIPMGWGLKEGDIIFIAPAPDHDGGTARRIYDGDGVDASFKDQRRWGAKALKLHLCTKDEIELALGSLQPCPGKHSKRLGRFSQDGSDTILNPNHRQEEGTSGRLEGNPINTTKAVGTTCANVNMLASDRKQMTSTTKSKPYQELENEADSPEPPSNGIISAANTAAISTDSIPAVVGITSKDDDVVGHTRFDTTAAGSAEIKTRGKKQASFTIPQSLDVGKQRGSNSKPITNGRSATIKAGISQRQQQHSSLKPAWDIMAGSSRLSSTSKTYLASSVLPASDARSKSCTCECSCIKQPIIKQEPQSDIKDDSLDMSDSASDELY